MPDKKFCLRHDRHPRIIPSGSGDKQCTICKRVDRDTKESVLNGLRLIRIRFGLPHSELPDLSPSELTLHLSFLLRAGFDRPSVRFPLRQSSVRNDEGLCRMKRLTRQERWEFALSLSSMKRNLPSGCGRHCQSMRSSWAANAFSTPPPPDPEYLTFVFSEVRKLLRKGWDKSYHAQVRSFVPNASSRAEGACNSMRADACWRGLYKDYVDLCTEERYIPTDVRAKYVEVPTAGKVRPLLVFDKKSDLLGPLHKTLYNYLSGQRWLLRGPPTSTRIKSVCIHRYQTSVDLTSATDNISHAVADTIMDAIFSKSQYVPRGIQRLAYSVLRPIAQMGEDHEQRVTHGQMMGAYLSFPLLCLQSYCMARWACRKAGAHELLINGDDCLISSEKPIGPYPLGAILNDLKTIRAENTVDINSTVFLRRQGRWREVRHLRRGAFLSDYRGIQHAAVACGVDVRWTDAFVRSRIGKKWEFLPSQLGLRSDSYAAFHRNRTLSRRRVHTYLPTEVVDMDPGLIAIPEGDIDDRGRLSTVLYLWEHGRWASRRPVRKNADGSPKGPFNPSVGLVRRTYGHRKMPPWKYLSFRPREAGQWGFGQVGKDRKIGFVPIDYQTPEEVSGLIRLEQVRRLFDAEGKLRADREGD